MGGLGGDRQEMCVRGETCWNMCSIVPCRQKRMKPCGAANKIIGYTKAGNSHEEI